MIKNFWKKVNVGKSSECWNWSGAKAKNGYGVFGSWNGERHMWRAHRLAWILSNFNDPGEMCVCHRCDNRLCCNPTHLFLGTTLDNVLDKIKKGRDHNVKKTHCKNGHPFFGTNLIIHPKKKSRVCRACRNFSSMLAKRKSRLMPKG